MTDLIFQPARKLARLLRTRKLSAVEVMKAFIAQVERLNPKVNAIVTFLPEAALKEAKKVDAKRARASGKDALGPLAGLPIAYKDLVNTKGIRTTLGSLVYKDNVPKEDALLVERLRLLQRLLGKEGDDGVHLGVHALDLRDEGVHYFGR